MKKVPLVGWQGQSCIKIFDWNTGEEIDRKKMTQRSNVNELKPLHNPNMQPVSNVFENYEGKPPEKE